jgi:hypothetical protein
MPAVLRAKLSLVFGANLEDWFTVAIMPLAHFEAKAASYIRKNGCD